MEKTICLGDVDFDGSYGNIRAYNTYNKDEVINFKMTIDKFGAINMGTINLENTDSIETNEEIVHLNGYDFFRDFDGVIRYLEVIPIENRFEILDL